MMATCLLNQIETGLSPPYDGSEMDELFPDLAGVEQHDDQQTYGADKEIVEHGPTSMTSMALESSEDDEHLMNYFLNKTGKSSEVKELELLTNSEKEDDLDINNTATVTTVTRTRTSLTAKRSVGKVIRVPSPDPEESELADLGLNRNAIMARLNRRKKKQHLQELETSVKSLKEENVSLLQDKKALSEMVDKLETEVRYLKGVIANQSELSSLLQNIGVTGLRLHTSFSPKSAKPGQSDTRDTCRSSTSSSITRRKRNREPSESEHESETDSESETEHRERGKHSSVSDHDYTIPKSSKELKKRTKVSKEPSTTSPSTTKASISELREGHPLPEVRKAALATHTVTRSMRTVTSKSGQNLTQTVVRVAQPVDGKKRSRCDKSAFVHSKENNRQMANRQRSRSEMEAGVCLHVSSGNVSLEFCAHCSNKAMAAAAAEAEDIAEEQLIEVVD